MQTGHPGHNLALRVEARVPGRGILGLCWGLWLVAGGCFLDHGIESSAVICDGVRCGPSEICVTTCNGLPSRCEPDSVDPSCEGCGCFAADPCTDFGAVCGTFSQGEVGCLCAEPPVVDPPITEPPIVDPPPMVDPPSCPSVSDELGFSGRVPEGPATVLEFDEESVLFDSMAEGAREFRWKGGDLSEVLRPGEVVSIRRLSAEGEWTLIDAEAGRLWVFRARAFLPTAPGMVPEIGYRLMLETACEVPSTVPGSCRVPPDGYTSYSLAVTGPGLRAPWLVLPGDAYVDPEVQIYFGGAVSQPGYAVPGSDDRPGCVVEADFQATLTVHNVWRNVDG